jgi:hypothetical protein
MNRTPKDRLTVTFDPTHETIKKAKVLAAEKGMTVSALFELMLEKELKINE